jgi:general secretion pathway protein J
MAGPRTHHGSGAAPGLAARQHPAQRGFTLIELLVALALMALMAAMSWRGLDGMVGAQKRLAQHSDDVLTLQTALAQWGADLDALAQQPNTPSIDWDGRALRLLRRGSQSAGEGLHVVAWSQRLVGGTTHWLRWQSPALSTRAELQAAWNQAARWGQNPSDDDRRLEVRITPLVGWQIFFYRGGAWTNPLSSADGSAPADSAAPAPAVAASGAPMPGLPAGAGIGDPSRSTVAGAMPDGVRLLLTLPPGQAVSGVLTRDWARPGLGGAQ